jgi:hypothetical protein
MPKTTVDENDLAAAWKNQVRLARKVFGVQPVSESQAMYEAAHCHFGRSVFAANAPHVFTAIHTASHCQIEWQIRNVLETLAVNHHR